MTQEEVQDIVGAMITDNSEINISVTYNDETGKLDFLVTGAGGDVTGPAGATDEAVARFDGVTGKLIQNGVVLISDAGAVTGVTTLAASGAITADDLLLYDTDASHTVTLHWNEDEAGANRTLNVVMGGADRTVTFSGSPTLADWFDQSVKQAASPTFAGATISGLTASRLVATDGAKALASSDLASWVVGTANQITVTDDGDGTITLSTPQSIGTGSDVVFASVTVNNSGMHILDTGGDHDLILAVGEDFAADRTLTWTLGDADRAITVSGDVTLNDWFDQSVKTTASPTFDDLLLYDTNASHTLTLHWNEDEAAANRTLNFVMGGADRSLTFEGDTIISQDYSTDATPQFGGLNLGTGELTVGSINRAADTLTLEIGGATIISIGATDVTTADGIGFNVYEDITFLGATTENQIKFPDNLPDALSFLEGSNKYWTIDTTDGTEQFEFFSDKMVMAQNQTDEAGNAAIDALGAEGGLAWIMEGTGTVDASIVIDQNNTWLKGCGASTVFDASASQTFHIIDLNGKSYCKVSDIYVKGEVGGSSVVDGINADLSQFSIVQNCWVDGSAAEGIGFTGDGTDFNIIMGNFAMNCDYAGIRLGNAEKSVVVGNISYNTGPGYAGIMIYTYCFDTVIVGNVAYSDDDHGIYLYASDRAVVMGNAVAEAAYYGIGLQGHYMAATGNSVYMATTSGTMCHSATHISMIGNTIYNPGWDGMRFYRTQYNTCLGNTIYHAGNTYADIYVYASGGTSSYNTFVGNVGREYVGGAEYGWSGEDTHYNVIAFNVFAIHDTGGIYLDSSCGHNIVFGNQLDGEAVARIIDDGSNNIVWDFVTGDVAVYSYSHLGIRNQMELRFYDNGNYVGFEAPALSADQIWVLPDADGNNGEALTTDGAGNLSWAAVGTGDVTAAANIADHTIVRGDGGAKGIQDTGITIDDSDVLISPAAATFDDLYLYDTDASHTLLLHWNEDESGANRTLNVVVNGGDRTIDLAGNLTVEAASIINQDLSTDATSVQFEQLGLGVAPGTAFLNVQAADGECDSGYVAIFFNQEATDDHSFGVYVRAGSTTNDYNVRGYDHDASNELWHVKGNGNAYFKTGVTIGSTSFIYSQEALHVKGASGWGSSNAEPIIVVESDESENAYIEFRGDGTGTEYFIGREDASNWDIFSIGRVGTGSDLQMNNAGNFGVGVYPVNAVRFYTWAPDAQSAIYNALEGYTLSDASSNYGVRAYAMGGSGTNNYGVYAGANNASARNWHYYDVSGNYSDATGWHDVSDPSRKTLIRDLRPKEFVDMYTLLDNIHVKAYRYKSEMVIGCRKDEKGRPLWDTDEWGNDGPVLIYGPAENAPERFGWLADELPEFLTGSDNKGISGTRMAAFNMMCLKEAKRLIKELQDETESQRLLIEELQGKIAVLEGN